MAEGVETEEQQTFLRENGGDEIQGHFFSSAISAEEISLLLRTPRLPQPSRIASPDSVRRKSVV